MHVRRTVPLPPPLPLRTAFASASALLLVVLLLLIILIVVVVVVVVDFLAAAAGVAAVEALQQPRGWPATPPTPLGERPGPLPPTRSPRTPRPSLLLTPSPPSARSNRPAPGAVVVRPVPLERLRRRRRRLLAEGGARGRA